ncbi:MAG: hypothetical protein M3M93_03380 [Actinomycetota bacterium]|nr:hypothetical protein [Actinomycetota bacterium]
MPTLIGAKGIVGGLTGVLRGLDYWSNARWCVQKPEASIGDRSLEAFG